MSEATPGQASAGQAAYERAAQLRDWDTMVDLLSWDSLPPEVQHIWEQTAQAGIDAFLAGDSVSAESIREALAAREPHAADGLREKLEAAEQEAADVRACAVGAFALIAVLARDDPAAQRQANDLREQIGMLPSPPEADIAAAQPAPEPSIVLGPCESHPGMVHAQFKANGVRDCLRSLADAAEASVRDQQEPQPVPVLHQLSGLVAGWRERAQWLEERPHEDDGAEAGTLREVTRQVLAVIGSAMEPQPAPEVAAVGTPADALRRAIKARIALWRHEAEPDGFGDDDDPITRDAIRVCANELAEDLVTWQEQAAERQPAPELADSRRYRQALENVFAVLDRQSLTYAERISYARTLIRAAREGK